MELETSVDIKSSCLIPVVLSFKTQDVMKFYLERAVLNIKNIYKYRWRIKNNIYDNKKKKHQFTILVIFFLIDSVMFIKLTSYKRKRFSDSDLQCIAAFFFSRYIFGSSQRSSPLDRTLSSVPLVTVNMKITNL